jgi:hypothetical protein
MRHVVLLFPLLAGCADEIHYTIVQAQQAPPEDPDPPTPPGSDCEDPPIVQSITIAEFDALREGMTVAEVDAITGTAGKLVWSTVDCPPCRCAGADLVEVYAWRNPVPRCPREIQGVSILSHPDDSSIQAFFRWGRLEAKVQRGLQRAP